jgi:hypothetical protein
MLSKKQFLRDFVNEFQDKGLYLLVGDALIELTEKNIREKAVSFHDDRFNAFFENKENIEHYKCTFCPLRGNGKACGSLKIIAPFVDVIDKSKSFDDALCIYRTGDEQVYYLGVADFQNALKYCVILSLTEYCGFGKKFKKYFHRIMPINKFTEMAIQLYMNIYCIHGGDKQEIEKVIMEMGSWASEAVNMQTRRLKLICKNDAFLNAFAGVQTAIEFLATDMHKFLQRDFDELI